VDCGDFAGIHGTAFATRSVNRLLGTVLGFLILRGSRWYYWFHWSHHRYTNDPARDPELSGSTVDRADPTAGSSGMVGRLATHALFLSGYPFGFERFSNMAAHAAVSACCITCEGACAHVSCTVWFSPLQPSTTTWRQ
jgi:fatty acid desaturase